MVITIIIPCYRSENTLEFVVNEIKDEILKRSGNEYQIILINDCSPDNTLVLLQN